MYNEIPNNYAEALIKLKWLRNHGQNDITEEKFMPDVILSGVQYLFDEALEGSYWTICWDIIDQRLWVRGIMGERLGEITPRSGFNSFVADFKDNADQFWQHLNHCVRQIVGSE